MINDSLIPLVCESIGVENLGVLPTGWGGLSEQSETDVPLDYHPLRLMTDRLPARPLTSAVAAHRHFSGTSQEGAIFGG